MKITTDYQHGVAPIVVLLLVLTATAVVTTVVIVGKGLLSPKPSSRPSEAQEKSPKDQSPTPAKISPSATPKSSPSTQADEKGVTVSTVFRSDNRALLVDFSANSFNSISQIYYNLNYDTDEPGKIRGTEGKIIPTSDQITGSIKNKPYIRRELVFGVCSKNLCRYDANPRNFKLTVITTKTSGQTFTQVLYPKY